MPDFFSDLSDDLQWIADDEYGGWLTVNELFNALTHGGVELGACSKRFMLFLDALRMLQQRFGGDRVCVIFAFVV